MEFKFQYLFLCICLIGMIIVAQAAVTPAQQQALCDLLELSPSTRTCQMIWSACNTTIWSRASSSNCMVELESGNDFCIRCAENNIIEVLAAGLVGTLPLSFSDLRTISTLSLVDSTQFLFRHDAFDGNDSVWSTQSLTLDGLNFNGTLPTSLSVLTGLTSLYLEGRYGVSLSEPVPSLSTLTRLRNLHIMTFAGARGPFPPGIDNITSLTSLVLARTPFRGSLPSSFASTGLTRLDLHSTSLAGTIPSWICSLPNLAVLDLSWPNGSPLGPWLCPWTMPNLTSLSMAQVDISILSGFVPDPSNDQFPRMDGMTRLKTLMLDGVYYGGAFPESIFALTQLEDVSFSSSGFTSINQDGLCNLTQLTGLSLMELEINESIAECFYNNLTNLQVLQLGGRFSLNLSKLCSMPDLYFLTLYELNLLSSPIPDCFTNMGLLELENSQVTGTIPSTMTRLNTLGLSGTNITGCVPHFPHMYSCELDGLSMFCNCTITGPCASSSFGPCLYPPPTHTPSPTPSPVIASIPVDVNSPVPYCPPGLICTPNGTVIDGDVVINTTVVITTPITIGGGANLSLGNSAHLIIHGGLTLTEATSVLQLSANSTINATSLAISNGGTIHAAAGSRVVVSGCINLNDTALVADNSGEITFDSASGCITGAFKSITMHGEESECNLYDTERTPTRLVVTVQLLPCSASVLSLSFTAIMLFLSLLLIG